MIRNNKGFSIIELLAIIFISSVVIWPLITTLVNNIEINDRLHTRRSATSIADGTLYGLDKLDFADLQTKVGNDPAFYIELNEDTCLTMDAAEDDALCIKIFAAIWNNLTLDATEFRVFIYGFNLDAPTIAALYADTDIPIEVRDEINLIPPSALTNQDLLRVTVWINYYTEPYQVVILNGVMFND